MTEKELWKEFCEKKNVDISTPYEAWGFGDDEETAEGEGDRSLDYWRRVHKEFFEECAEESGIPFTEESKVVCEQFSLEYVAGE